MPAATVMLVVLVVGWTWSRVMTDCLGNPEPVAYYYLSATVRWNLPATCCCNESDEEYDCTRTLPAPPLRFGLPVADPGTGLTVATTQDPELDPSLLPDPPSGGLTAWPWVSPENPEPVVAVDAAGNRSDEACP